MINAHHFFTNALSRSADIIEVTNGNIFIYPCDEELGENPEKPYIVVENAGSQAVKTDKDAGFDSQEDNTTINIIVCGDSDEQIVNVAQLVRDTIRQAMASFDADQFEDLGWWLTDSYYSDSGVGINEYTMNRSTTITYRIETEK